MTDIMNDWYGPDAATFGDRVAAARESAGMTQGQLARRMGVKKTTLIGWEQDLSEPRANKLSMLSGLLNVSMSWLLTGEGDDLSAPSEDTLGEDMAAIARELRSLREDLRQQAERAGRLEKTLRRLVATQESAE
ncbi:helix-turn-helix domain-containing protein [Epibacterium sp. DP7N7-1]|jgi:transcriptional regulator with XRE-family HTH domain|uniref:Transcriptional regulator n=1 Tax=Tritonibacter mobilis F1926 TaxID=1265309 RepID=A0A1B1A9U1_9RHOB|nr:helix-turn-helix transcriptional regulator [Tritonibacter mobilis]EEW57686.1 transcriptional regulator, XRE family [Ruegeria sp. TrichCH4B]MBW3244616.1 helix-turn-helix domain-containing protein [Epibacterium sp. DP7N7-1]MCZ4269610.1 helix-turn-helix transcriptional regulator [Rhodobacteraceae bacterium G21628-S1]NKX28598.1 helix-turn-helix transcriptional regulator [Rhodobacteraceae bacterium R_SAG6]NKX39302.1 helix-turn-helix transcriptional regulator [Rhodobacteraceae bacterium R_SAG5]